MTVTQRRSRGDPSSTEQRNNAESGVKVTCDFCHIDITNTVRFKCAHADCKELDICPSCFCEGKEGSKHRPWHDYMVEEQLFTPVFTPDWGADEEVALISGLITYGLGNWLEVAGHVGTRTKEECERHYLQVYLGVDEDEKTLELKDGTQIDTKVDEDSRKRRREFMPPMDRVFNVDPDEFQAKKKARIEDMRKPQALSASSAAPMVSAPTNHEVAGYMPGRLEFEHEVENEAEVPVKDMEFGLVYKFGGDEQPEAKVTKPPGDDDEEDEEDADEDGEEDEEGKKLHTNDDHDKVKKEEEEETEDVKRTSTSPKAKKKDKGKAKATQSTALDVEDDDDLELKLAMLDIYFSKLDKREEAKEIIFDRGLTEHKRIQTVDRKRPRDERELLNRYKVFAKLQTAQDYETFIEGLVFESSLRKRIAELQEYRRMGVTTGFEAEAYENSKVTRAGYRLTNTNRIDRPAEVLSGARVNAGTHRFLHGVTATPPPDKTSREQTPRAPHIGRKPAAPLNLANSASLDLLSPEEQSLCSTLRVLPKPYLTIKELYIRENERRKGRLKRRDARKMMKIDVNKSGKIFDFLVSSGMLVLSYDPEAKIPQPSPSKVSMLPPDTTDIYDSANGVNGVELANGHFGPHGMPNQHPRILKERKEGEHTNHAFYPREEAKQEEVKNVY